MEPEDELPGTSVPGFVAAGIVLIGLLSGLYNAYDVVCPNQFVGDMYGLVVFPRVLLLLVLFLGMGIGVSVWVVGRSGRSRPPVYTGRILSVCASLLLLLLAVSVARERAANRIRQAYPSLPVQELLRLARDQKDQSALEAIIVKGDPAAVPGLTTILLDTNEDGNLRCVAAHALGSIGGSEAEAALKKAKSRGGPPWLLDAVGYALQGLTCKVNPGQSKTTVR